MKTFKKLFIVCIVMLTTIAATAQDKKSDFFAGKWATVTTGTPGGDGKGLIVLKRNADGKLTGSTMGADGSGEIAFTRVDEKEKSITVYFKARGYDVYIYLEKTSDDNHLTGSTMDMFDTNATRVIENQ